MTRRRIDQGPDLFAWADAQVVEHEPAVQAEPAQVETVATKPARHGGAIATLHGAPPAAPHGASEPAVTAPTPPPQRADVIDFLNRREDLPRFILCRPPPFFHIDRAIARKEGRLPPAPILKLQDRHLAVPGSYSAGPERRQG